jgi:maleate isomerase
VLTSTLAIRAMAENLGVSRLALLAPYPAWLATEAKRYFASVGLEIVTMRGLPQDLADTRGIYRLQPSDVAEMAAGMDLAGADAVLIGGTGMPSLPFIASHGLPVPVFSSNLALAASLMSVRMTAPEAGELARAMLSPDAAWRKRLALWGAS